jgi:predicted phage terminase large subunit-like protein
MVKASRLSMRDLTRAMFRAVHTTLERATPAAGPTARPDSSLDHLSWSRRYLPHYFKKPPSELHRWLAHEIHEARKHRGAKINVLGPRGGAKSTIANTAYILRCAVEGTEPFVVILGRTEKLAAAHLGHVKHELESNADLARDYPEACGKGSTWADDELRLRNGVLIQAYGAGQALRGARNAAERPSLVVCDDLQEIDAITSTLTRDRDRLWFDGSVLKIGTRETNFINLCNALHRDALGSVLQRNAAWRSRVFSSIIEWPHNMGLWEQWAELLHNHDDPQAMQTASEFYNDNFAAMNEGARVLWPEWESLYDLMMMRYTEGLNTFQRDKQATLAAVEAQEWPDSYFDDTEFDEWPTSWQVKTLALDPSKGKDSRRGDYSAFVALMIGNDGTLYIDADLARRPSPQMVSDGVAIFKKFRPDAFGVEANAWQDLLAAEFQREFSAQGMVDAAPYKIENRVSKQVRIRRLGPYLAQRRIRFKKGSPGSLLLLSQMRDFPDTSAHDDGPDALEMALRLACEILGAEHVEHPDHVDN